MMLIVTISQSQWCVCLFGPRGHHDRSENAELGESDLTIQYAYFCGNDSGEADYLAFFGSVKLREMNAIPTFQKY